jgi:beta-lactamase class A
VSRESSATSRRALLVTAALAPLAGCASDHSASPSPAARPSETRSAAARPSETRSATRPPDTARWLALERAHGARLGVLAVATATGTTVAYRADERFAFCSTFKGLAAAAVLHGHPLSHLDTLVTYTKGDVTSTSPITQDHVATGLTIRQLCEAGIRYSDDTAGNPLMRDTGGPAGLTAYLRGLGDPSAAWTTTSPS